MRVETSAWKERLREGEEEEEGGRRATMEGRKEGKKTEKMEVGKEE